MIQSTVWLNAWYPNNKNDTFLVWQCVTFDHFSPLANSHMENQRVASMKERCGNKTGGDNLQGFLPPNLPLMS